MATPAQELDLKTRTKQLSSFYLGKGAAPSDLRFRTRAILRTSRYIVKFLFWRLIRYARYAATGAIIAAIGTGVLGTAISGAGALLVPSIPVGICLGLATGAVKFGWRHSRFSKAFHQGGEGDARRDERQDAKADPPAQLPTVWERL